MIITAPLLCFFFFNDTATTEIYTLSLHDALPISQYRESIWRKFATSNACRSRPNGARFFSARRKRDRKSTRLNSSHDQISYAVFCLKKKNEHTQSNQLIQANSMCIALTLEGFRPT